MQMPGLYGDPTSQIVAQECVFAAVSQVENIGTSRPISLAFPLLSRIASPRRGSTLIQLGEERRGMECEPCHVAPGVWFPWGDQDLALAPGLFSPPPFPGSSQSL